MSKVKLVLEASLIGRGCKQNYLRSGIFRYIDALISHLALRNDIDLSALVSYGEQGMGTVKKHLARKGLANVPVIERRGDRLAEFVNKYRRVSRTNGKLEHYLVDHLALPGLVRASRLFNQLPVPGLDSETIFHCLEPLSYDQHIEKKVKRYFMTVYDLFHIMFPQYYDHSNGVYKKILKRSAKKSYYLCVSQSTKNDLCNFVQIDPGRVFVTHLAADKNLYYQVTDTDEIAEVKRKYLIPKDKYFLCLNTLEPRKNISRLIKAFMTYISQEKIKDVNLVIAGDKGWDYNEIFSILSSYKSQRNRIILTGYVQDVDQAALYSGALGFIYPSLYEGFGLPVLEAMQCGAPVIVSNTSSLPEVVGDVGIMIDPYSIDSISQAMHNIYSRGEYRKELSVRSLKRAKKFSWENCVNDTLMAYRKA